MPSDVVLSVCGGASAARIAAEAGEEEGPLALLLLPPPAGATPTDLEVRGQPNGGEETKEMKTRIGPLKRIDCFLATRSRQRLQQQVLSVGVD